MKKFISLFLLFGITAFLFVGCTRNISSEQESSANTVTPSPESMPESVSAEESSDSEEESASSESEKLPLLLTEEGMIWGSTYRSSLSVIDAPNDYRPGTQTDLEIWLNILQTREICTFEIYLSPNDPENDPQTALPLSSNTANTIFHSLCNAEFLPADPETALSVPSDEVLAGILPSGGTSFILSFYDQHVTVYFFTLSENTKTYTMNFFIFEINNFDYDSLHELILSDMEITKAAPPSLTQSGTFYDGSAVLPLVGSEKTLLATQEKLDLLNEYIRSDRVARIDVYTGPSGQPVTLPLSADIADIIWHLFAKTELLLHDTLESVATGGGTTLVAYDAEGNLLFTASIGDYFFVTFAEDPSITWFFTTTNGQLTSTRIQSILYKLLEDDHGQDFAQ